MSFKVLVAGVASVVLLAGCESPPTETLGKAGRFLGASVGAFGGGVAVGAATELVKVEGELAEILNEQEQEQASDATKAALDANVTAEQVEDDQKLSTTTRAAWTSDSEDVKGSAQVVEVTDLGASNECRTIQEIAIVRGDEVKQSVKYCKDAGGKWKPVDV